MKNIQFPLRVLVLGLYLGSGCLSAFGQAIQFSGYEWKVKSGEKYGPGPNRWDPKQVWVDSEGQLHLKIAHTEQGWVCAEVQTSKVFGFGTFEFEVTGPIDRMDPNVVLGLFTYPAENGSKLDGTNEIDIEFSHWGVPSAPPGNYTIWPARRVPKHLETTFRFSLDDDHTTHRFLWQSKRMVFEFQQGQGNKRGAILQHWTVERKNYLDLIPQNPEPILMNLWLMRGMAPTDGKEVEIVIRRFRFIPDSPLPLRSPRGARQLRERGKN